MNSYKKSLQMIISSDPFKKNIPRILKKHGKDFDFDEELKDILGTKVNIVQSGKKGRIEIQCFSKEDMNRLVDLLKRLG